MNEKEISRATMGRVPLYLHYLKETEETARYTSATALSKALGLGEVLVRKDLSALSGDGKPKTGYETEKLILTLEKILHRDKESRVIIVGAGKLGRALLDYGGFADYGLSVVAGFDIAVKTPEKSHAGKPILPMDAMDSFCRENDVKIGVITVPAASAQTVADALVHCGIRALWSFAPCPLSLPKDIAVQYENMALSLAYLNQKIE